MAEVLPNELPERLQGQVKDQVRKHIVAIAEAHNVAREQRRVSSMVEGLEQILGLQLWEVACLAYQAGLERSGKEGARAVRDIDALQRIIGGALGGKRA